jgi:hypothetical protein
MEPEAWDCLFFDGNARFEKRFDGKSGAPGGIRTRPCTECKIPGATAGVTYEVLRICSSKTLIAFASRHCKPNGCLEFCDENYDPLIGQG